MDWSEFTSEMLKIAYECFGLGILIGIGIGVIVGCALKKNKDKNERHI